MGCSIGRGSRHEILEASFATSKETSDLNDGREVLKEQKQRGDTEYEQARTVVLTLTHCY